VDVAADHVHEPVLVMVFVHTLALFVEPVAAVRANVFRPWTTEQLATVGTAVHVDVAMVLRGVYRQYCPIVSTMFLHVPSAVPKVKPTPETWSQFFCCLTSICGDCDGSDCSTGSPNARIAS